MDTDRGLRLPHLPHGRFLHVPPTEPTADWDTDFGTPWWSNKNYLLGQLSAKTRKVVVYVGRAPTLPLCGSPRSSHAKVLKTHAVSCETEHARVHEASCTYFFFST
jgi:hypothetical protein